MLLIGGGSDEVRGVVWKARSMGAGVAVLEFIVFVCKDGDDSLFNLYSLFLGYRKQWAVDCYPSKAALARCSPVICSSFLVLTVPSANPVVTVHWNTQTKECQRLLGSSD